MIESLLVAGADVNKANLKGNTVLHLADEEVDRNIRKLILAGAELEVRNADGLTPLLLAADRGWPDVINVLKEHGADMSPVDHDANTGLLRILEKNNKPKEGTLRLLAFGNINRKTECGMTPLMLAAKKLNNNTLRILLELGAEPNIVNTLSVQACTALSVVLNKVMTKRHVRNDDRDVALECADELIRHNAFVSLP
ncbi:ankyrin [Plakobranchus ocellatus]|uniref:Ankyrin n=1 Tax=Plakobranchus ocellatus TaxID=259542 RepID=A0AAV4CYU6_9GAST|nr:ankyrin [Plakobranchus ocellatus]